MPNPYNPLTSDNSEDQNTLGSQFSRSLFSGRQAAPSAPAHSRLGLSRRQPNIALTGVNGAAAPGAGGPDGWLPADRNGVTRLRSSVSADNPYQPIAPNSGPADHGMFGLDPGVRRGPATPAVVVDPNAPKPGRMDSTPVGSRGTMFSRNGDPGATNAADLPLAAQTLPPGVAAAPGSGNTELGKVASIPPVPPPPQQTERADPLSGDVSPVPGGATVDVNPATPQNPAQPQNQALGFSSQGTATPQTQDATPGSYTGGVGLYKKTFSSRRGADAYHQFTRDLFGDSTAPDVTDRD